MTREEYIKVSVDNNANKMPVIYYYYQLKGGELNYNEFLYWFTSWLKLRIGIENLEAIIYFVFKELDNHFKVSNYDKSESSSYDKSGSI